MQIFTNWLGWLVLSQLALAAGCILFEPQANALYAIYQWSTAYSFALCASFFFLAYYAFIAFKASMKRDAGSRIKAMNRAIKEGLQ